MRARSEQTVTLQGLLLLAVLMAGFSLFEPRFLSGGNLLAILSQSAPVALAAFGQMAAVGAGEVDLSMGSVAAIGSMVAVMAAQGYGNLAGWLCGSLVGAVVGTVNGLLVARVGIPSFVATVGMLTSVQGLALILSGGVPVEFPPQGFQFLGQGLLGPVPVSALIVIAGFLVLDALFHKTVFGRYLFAVGANRTAAYYSAVPTAKVRFLSLVLSGLLAGVASVLLASRVVSGQPNMAPDLPFQAIAALAVGGIALSGGRGTLAQAIVGVLVLGVLQNGLRLANVSTYVQQMATGVITVAALISRDQLTIPVWLRGRAREREAA